MERGKGVALGIAIAMTSVIALLAFELRGIGAMYADFGNTRLPLLTQITISAAWRVGAPVVGAAACAGLWFRRPPSLVPYVVVAVLLVATAVLTWYGPRLPIFELTGNIKAD
jgi:hypothetical protein